MTRSDESGTDCVRNNVDTLLGELGYRFRRVETARTFGSKFSNSAQKPGETVEDFGAELKTLYDKAHPNRDGQTRQEDLLRRFLDGLFDEGTRMQVEFVKEPMDIDESKQYIRWDRSRGSHDR